MMYFASLWLAVLTISFVLPAALFSFAGGQAGARFMAARMQGRTISLLFSAILVIFSLRLLYQSLA